jgi:hypothetical protein
VLDRREQDSRFNGFSAIPEAAEAAGTVWPPRITGLKPGANENFPLLFKLNCPQSKLSGQRFLDSKRATFIMFASDFEV